MGKQKRNVPVVVISDIHLGTYGCKAKALNQYLKSISPEILIINGDLIDFWQLSKSYFPPEHMKVLKRITNFLSDGVEVVYITGNHDEVMRKFVGFRMGKFSIANKYVIELNGKKAWFFHGDVFDVVMQHSKWIARLGANGYGILILMNRWVNYLLSVIGKKRISLSKKIKTGVTNRLKAKSQFEQVATELARENGYDFVGLGHIHQAEIKEISDKKGTVTYLNSGDWVESLTALEYNQGQWSLYEHKVEDNDQGTADEEPEDAMLTNKELFHAMVEEFKNFPITI